MRIVPDEVAMRGALDIAEEKLGVKILYAYLQGSQNYNLDTDDSDVDIKAFSAPSFDDFYIGKMTSKTLDYDWGQITVHDIRMFPGLIGKMNPTYIEAFFSKILYFGEPATQEILPSLWDRENSFNSLFASSWPTLLRAIFGTFNKKLEEMHHPTEIREPVIEKYGFDIKSASHALRLAKLFFDTYQSVSSSTSPFQSYRDALRLDGVAREKILAVKLGTVPESAIIEELEEAEQIMDKVCASLPKPTEKADILSSIEKEIRTLVESLYRQNLL